MSERKYGDKIVGAGIIARAIRALTRSLLVVLAAVPVAAEESQPVLVSMQTGHGEIRIELFADKAPVTVSNFLRYVDGGHYDGSSFYRTVRYGNDNGNPRIEVIQGGRGDAEAVFDAIAHETTEQTGILHADGVISMARGGVGTATSEFFICVGDQPGLDFGDVRNPDKQGFAAFGRVVSGMEAVRAIHGLPSDAAADNVYVEGQIIEEPVVIVNVRRVEGL